MLDTFNIHSKRLFDVSVVKQYDMVIGTGSNTYYATKVLAKEMHVKSVVMMLPKGYRLNFDVIFAQSHDIPLRGTNIFEIPANFSYVEPQGIHKPKNKSIGIVIGGDNKVFTIDIEALKKQLDFIKAYYKDYDIAITTSPRTPDEIEKLVASYHFEYEVIFSKNLTNPIPDFLEQCETVFITGDSTSMISEAISYGKSNVVVLPLESKGGSKFTRFINGLEKEGYVHIFDGNIKNKNKKINFLDYTKRLEV
ncbi:MAG TPA: hypothetical protein EYG73_07090 [Arcobacter sp.]|nr:hypothetical protein [Arcobacter sp.]